VITVSWLSWYWFITKFTWLSWLFCCRKLCWNWSCMMRKPRKKPWRQSLVTQVLNYFIYLLLCGHYLINCDSNLQGWIQYPSTWRTKGWYQNEDQHYQNEDQIIHVQTPLYSATVQTSLRLGVFLLSFLVFRCWLVSLKPIYVQLGWLIKKNNNIV